MHIRTKLYVSAGGIIVMTAAIALITQQGFAWTNPSMNPPLGNPAITVSGTNVGVGVTPSAKLHVVGSESRFGGVASGYISIYNASGRSGYIQANQGTDLRIAADNDPMTFYTSNTERVRINTAGNLSVGTASPDANYKITTANGGIKADANTGQAAGYFNNIGGGPAIIAGTGGITLGGVNQTSWPSGNDNLGNHTATAALNMAGNNITGLNFLTLSGAITPNAVGVDSGMTGARHYQFGYQEGGAWANPYPDLILGYHTGLKLGAYNGYSGTRFYNDHPSIPGALEIFSVGNGDNHVRVLNNLYVTGNVGIGTSAPAVKLHVNGSVRGDQAGALRIDSGYGTLDVGAMNPSYAHFQTDRPTFYFNKSVAVDGALSNYSNAYYLAQSGVSYLNGGNVGIGTGSPAYRLDVNGDANATRLCIAGVCQSAWPTGIGGSGTANYLSKWTSGSAIGNSLVYDNGTIVSVGTNLGVGTTDPLSQMAGTQGIAIFKNSYPAIGFKNDSTSWLWYGASNTFRMWNASAGDILTADTGGYVGIGTTVPAYKLDVAGTVRTQGDFVANANYGLGLVGTYSPYRYRNVYAMDTAYRLSADGTSPGNFYGIANSYEPDYGGAGNNAQAKTGLGHQFLFMTSGVTQTAIGTGIWTNGNLTSGGSVFVDGNLGVGTRNPAYKLDVNGDANATRLCIAGNCQSAWPSGSDSTKVLKAGDTMTGNLSFGSVGLGAVGVYDPTKTQAVWSMGSAYMLPAGGGTTNYGTLYGLGWSYEPNYGGAGNNPQSKAGLSHQLLVMHSGITKTAIGDGIWTSGNLTFGLANPTINSSSYLIIPGGAYFGSGTVYAESAIQARGGIHDDSHANLTISGGTSGVTYFAGNVGIGTTDPGAYKLNVAGHVNVAGNANIAGAIYAQSTATYTLEGENNSFGGVGVFGWGRGTASTGVSGISLNIGVQGNGNNYDFYAAGGGVNYGAPSSIRWKKNITPISDILGKIANISTVYFDWDAERGGRKDLGFIGEEVGKYFPEVVAWDKNDPGYVTGMDYSKMTPILLGAIKEQQVQIESQKKKLEELSAKIENMR